MYSSSILVNSLKLIPDSLSIQLFKCVIHLDGGKIFHIYVYVYIHTYIYMCVCFSSYRIIESLKRIECSYMYLISSSVYICEKKQS